jgi:hypothetical protein
MASGDTKLSICSDALIYLGQKPLTSFAEVSDSAQICDRLYDDIRDMVLCMYPWSFSFKKTQLAKLITTPAFGWKYEYQLPGDRLAGVRAVYSDETVSYPSTTEFDVQQDKLLTNIEEAYIDYQFRTPENDMPTYFVNFLKYALAANFAQMVTDQLTKAEYYQRLAFGLPEENMRGGFFRQCMTIDAQSRPSVTLDNQDAFPLINVRFG